MAGVALSLFGKEDASTTNVYLTAAARAMSIASGSDPL